MAIDNYPIRKTGSDDNERAQLNKALREISDILQRAEGWDAAVSWGDHNEAGYASELTEIEQFFSLGFPQDLQVLLTTRTTNNGTQEDVVEVSWKRILDDTVVYDLEIRKSDIGAVSDPNDSEVVLQNTTQYSVPIIANDVERDRVVYTSQFQDGQQYWFRVRIRRERLVSPWSAFVNIEIPLNLVAPPAPANLVGEALPASAQISWEYDYESNPDVAAIQIERDGNIIDAIARPAVTFKDGVLPVGNQVTYRVRAVLFNDVSGTNVASAYSNAVNVTPVDITFGTPSVPQNLTLTSEIITNNTGGQIGRVTAEWDAIPGNNITYDLEIERRDFNTGAVLGILETPTISNPDDVQNNNPKYEWIGNINDRFAVRVRSRNATTVSAYTAYEIIDVIPDANSPGDINPASIVLTPLYQGALIQWDIPTADNYFETRVDRRQTAPAESASTTFETIGRVSRPISFLFDDVGELTVDSNKVDGSITIRSASAPSQRPDGDPLVVGDIWIDTDDNDTSRSWDGDSWELTYTVRERFQYRLTPISSAGQQANSVITAEVTPSNIPDASITASQIIARSITADRIESNTITAGEINVGSLTADSAFIGGIQQNSILNLIIRSATEPTQRPDGSALKIGDIWIDTSDGDRPHNWDGTDWIRAYTAITGGDIVTGTITANNIDVDNLTSDTAFISDIEGLIDGELVSTGVTATFRQDNEPTQRDDGSALQAGDIWIDTNDGNRPYTYDGRTPYANAGWIRAYTAITGGDIETGTITANNIDVDSLTADSVFISDIKDLADGEIIATGVTATFRQDNEPTQRADGSALRVGDIWIDTNDGNRPYTWDGSSWIRAYTAITGGDIVTGTITADKINVGSLTADLVFISDVQDLADGEIIATGVTATFRQDSQPTQRADGSALKAGDIWIDTNDGNRPYTYDGRSPYANAGWIRSYTAITGGDIETGTITANNIDVNDLTADTVFISDVKDLADGEIIATGVTATFRQDNAPTQRADGSALAVGDIWIDTNDGNRPYSYSGTSWIKAYTSITGGDIVTGTITANQLDISNVTAAVVDDGNLTADSEVNVTIRATTEPTVRPSGGVLREGDIWIDTDDGNRPYTYNGSTFIKAYTSITGGDIVTGTITANKLDVDDIEVNSTILVNGADISRLTNDLNFTDFAANETTVTIRSATEPPASTGRPDGTALVVGDVWINTASGQGDRPSTWSGSNWVPAYTSIDGGSITTGTVNTDRLNVNDIIADGQILVTNSDISRLNNDAGYTDFAASDTTITIRSLLEPTTRPPLPNQVNGDALVEGDIWIDTGDGDKPYSWNGSSWIQAYTIIDGGNIETGSIDADKISVTNLEAISTNTGTLTSNLIRTAASGQRLELTDVGTDATYAIWIGDSTKNDGNGVFWVKHNGDAFINKTDFDIQTGQVNVGAFSNANAGTTGDTFDNTLVASSGLITVGSGGIKFDVNFFYNAVKQSIQTAESACAVGGTISGEIQLLRNTSNTISGATAVQAITFSSDHNRVWVPDSDPSLTPGICTIRNNSDIIKTYVDTAVSGDYYYFVRFSQWNANGFTQAEVNTNTLYVTWTTGN